MNGQASFWTADAVSAAATALSLALAAMTFVVDRSSAWSRRRADASRLLKLIAGDLGLELARLRTVSVYINSSAVEARLGSGEELLVTQQGAEAALEAVLASFNVGRTERICETTNVFDAAMSDHLSSIIMLRTASLASLQVLASTEAQDDRREIARHVRIQVNALQLELLNVFNVVVAARGATQLQQPSLISGG